MRAYLSPLMAASVLALGGCAYDTYGGGYGYNDYGYYSPYYGSGYGSPYYGWYGDYYYPGSGVYVYDSYRRPRVWSNTERSYWIGRQPLVRTTSTTATTPVVRENWTGFERTARDNRRRVRTRPNQQ